MPDNFRQAVDQFNEAATRLGETSFPRARTPDEWAQFAAKPKDYPTLLAAVQPVVLAFQLENPASRKPAISQLNPDALHLLRVFAGHVAVQAVRSNSPLLIKQGLVAVALLGQCDDLRDLAYSLAVLHFSAVKLEMNTGQLFNEVASLATSRSVEDAMSQFPSRSPKDRDLAVFGFREVRTGAGFNLLHVPSDHLPARGWKGLFRYVNSKVSPSGTFLSNP